MELCSDNHDEICYNGIECPMCSKIEEISDLTDKIEDMELKMEEKNDKIADLEKTVEAKNDEIVSLEQQASDQ